MVLNVKSEDLCVGLFLESADLLVLVPQFCVRAQQIRDLADSVYESVRGSVYFLLVLLDVEVKLCSLLLL